MTSVAKDSCLPVHQSERNSHPSTKDEFLLTSSNGKDYPTSRSLPFPYPSGPYPQQAALMDALLEGIPRSAATIPSPEHKTRILALESPTGTGKSLSLACAGLAWLDHEEHLYYAASRNTIQNKGANNNNTNTTTTTPWKEPPTATARKSSPTSVVEASALPPPQQSSSTTGIDWLDSWKPPQEDDRAKEEQAAKDRELERHENLLQALDELRLQLHPPASSSKTSITSKNTTNHTDTNSTAQRHRERRENLLRMALTKSRMEERKRAREQKRKRKRPHSMVASAPRLVYEEEENNEKENAKHTTRRNLTPGTAEWLLRKPNGYNDYSGETTPPSKPPQIVYAARTHSQLSQFVSEIRKTRWGKTLRVVALGSRGQGLCGELTTKGGAGCSSSSSLSEARLTEDCLELRQQKGKNGCSHYASHESVATLALHGMVEATDLEDLVALGKATKTCAYYAAREALPHAQLVVLPYASLCSPSSRQALGITLHSNTLVLVDEAHNLPDAIANLTSAKVSLPLAMGARDQLQAYLQTYVDRLSPHHLRLLGDLKRLIRGLIASMEAARSKTSHGANPPSPEQQQQQQQRYLLSSSQFLVSQKLETINLFPVLRYMKESKLSQKLLGFLPKPSDAAGTPSNIPSHISPMSVVETFLEKLTYASDDDGQVVVDRGDSDIDSNLALASPSQTRREAHLRFCVLNPAVQARDALWTAPRAVALVGGTLQPLDVMMRELIPGTVAEHAARAQSSWTRPSFALNPYRTKEDSKGTLAASTLASKQTKIYQSPDFWAFTCGHVVDSSQVLLQSLTRVEGISIDVRHKTRSTPSMTRAIGIALVKLCQSVRHGMVVFLPSYKYEAILVDAWKNSRTGTAERSIWDQLQQATTVVREPKEASQVEATLALYSRAASKSPKGALLLSVVGGKLSEGINFANDLCRCVAVVGLPFADRSDPLLQEKLKLVAATSGGSVASKGAASDYYRSLCLRAVNQSVGRAIRHAKDWATIVLMDVRYPTDEAIARGLPSWLTESTPSWRKDSGDLTDVLRRTEAFFDGR